MARVLIIDDEQLTRVILEKTLKSNGHEVIVASNGHEGYAIIEKGNLDVVITDLLMPGKGGVELIYDVNQNQPNIKVIVISSAFEYINAAEQVGVFRIIRKPFAIKDVLQCIDDAMRES